MGKRCPHEAWECVGGWHTCSDCKIGLGARNSEALQAGHNPKLCEICEPKTTPQFVTKDSGKREEYASGMRRDTQEGKPRFDLLLVDGVGFQDQFLTRFAALLARGADKYGERNWQLASSNEELQRFRASALRHMFQWACGEEDEDHAAAVAFNLMAYETIKRKL